MATGIVGNFDRQGQWRVSKIDPPIFSDATRLEISFYFVPFCHRSVLPARWIDGTSLEDGMLYSKCLNGAAGNPRGTRQNMERSESQFGTHDFPFLGTSRFTRSLS